MHSKNGPFYYNLVGKDCAYGPVLLESSPFEKEELVTCEAIGPLVAWGVKLIGCYHNKKDPTHIETESVGAKESEGDPVGRIKARNIWL